MRRYVPVLGLVNGRGRTAVLLSLLLLTSQVAAAKEAQWIWSPAYEKELAPAGTCYFRKTFTLTAAEHGTVQISCDDSYELFVNGRHVGSGQNWKVLDVYDVTKYLVQGLNTVAVKAANTEQGSAGLLARVVVKQPGGTHIDYSSDSTWKTALKEFPQWQKSRCDDTQWLAARSFGAMGSTLPWGNEVVVAGADARFKVMPEFHVEWVIAPKETGSLICMTFDEAGAIIASRENGPLIRISDEDKDGLIETVTPYCDEIKNCQGLLVLDGNTYAVGQGPSGSALYKLTDGNHDGKIDRVDALVKFAGEMSEHGPHALTLGPDGMLYMIVGNFAHIENKYDTASPYHGFYEGDLNVPRFEDPGGHAAGIKAPGGTIIRTDTAGSTVELVAGGLQNPYDLAFNQDGELFTCDSDMEWDSGMPWYRPTRLNHVSPGSEFGWRSGWSKWPNYYADSLAPTLEMGRGSPAGMDVYTHFMFPKRYHDALFVCDWSRGRILAIRTKQHGASYKAAAEVFVEGQPLNATDIGVGADGWLYFCTGGRETEGGVYRIVWDGTVPAEMLARRKGVNAVLEQPQLNSAWARHHVAQVKAQLGDDWGTQLSAVAADPQRPSGQRVRALELLQLFGPPPSKALLIEVSNDRSTALRTKAAYLMGLHVDKSTHTRLQELLDDKEFAVLRATVEALIRSKQTLPAAKIVELLASPDRYVVWAAGRALQEIPRDQWEAAVLKHNDTHVFVAGSVALLGESPSRATAEAVLNRGGRILKGYVSDDDFLGVLRVFQLALIKGQISGDSIVPLRTQLAEEYPSRDIRMNRELVRLLAYLQEPTFPQRLVDQLKSDSPNVEKMQLLMHARFITEGWTTPLKLEVLKADEEARTVQGGHSFAGFIENASRDFFAGFNEEERRLVLADGAQWPSSALSVLAKLPSDPSPEMLVQIQKLDRQLKRVDTEAAKKLRIGICAVLGASADPKSMAYLRGLYDSEPDRRVPVAMSLAQQPGGDNWDYLVRSLPIVEGAAAQEVLTRLTQVDEAPEDAEPYRQVILRGLMLRENGSRKAVELLDKWTGDKLTDPDEAWDAALAKWQAWFVEQFPDLPAPELPVESEQSHWTYQELLSFLTGPQASQGQATRGAVLFEKAQCIKCHRFGEKGETIGPDLTNISKRFQKKEILESILFPSHVISDQYASHTVETKSGKSYVGLTAPRNDGSLVVLQSNGEKVVVPEDDIEEVTRSKVSAMPEGLLNPLSPEEIVDLFAFLSTPPRAEVARRPGTRTR